VTCDTRERDRPRFTAAAPAIQGRRACAAAAVTVVDVL
jgi:hypothetical protein